MPKTEFSLGLTGMLCRVCKFTASILWVVCLANFVRYMLIGFVGLHLQGAGTAMYQLCVNIAVLPEWHLRV